MIPLLLPTAAGAPPVTSGAFAYWMGRSGAPTPPAPVVPPKGAYWHAQYWPDTPPTRRKKSRRR